MASTGLGGAYDTMAGYGRVLWRGMVGHKPTEPVAVGAVMGRGEGRRRAIQSQGRKQPHIKGSLVNGCHQFVPTVPCD